MTCDSLLRNISMVFQKVYLFHDTIENNIRFGNPSATQEEIIDAAKKARCHDFIMALPDGYETVIGEGGSTLSGGEKQRISIARAILKNANIVILDEATASIDPENEHLIQQAISELTIGKTVIVIAHRLATIEHADQILVVDKGQVVQKGTHQEFVQQDFIVVSLQSVSRQRAGALPDNLREKRNMKLHASGEDYLETILVLQKKLGMVRSVDVARHMEVSKPSVCHAVATLRDGGFLAMDEDHFLHLTDVGCEVAERIYERHCFFTEQLIAAGVDPKTAEADACRIEHIISDESFDRLKEADEQKQE